MKKIGILFGQENSFPQAFVDRINEKKVKGISAEFVLVDEVFQGRATDYAVILDRISQDVPFYRAYLKNAAISGTAVMNNPFWWSADEKFFNNALASKIGVPVPKTYLLPSKEMPTDTSSASFRNLKFPMDWAHIFQEIGFPAYMKPHAGGGWKSVYKVTDVENMFQSYSETGQLVMLLQEEIQFESYFRCYCLGRKYVRIMQYEPRNPHHLRYVTNGGPVEKKLLKTIEEYVLRLNNALGYDFNTVEFAVRNGIPYAIDFCNPAPDADLFSVGQENFDWVVENAANMAIERAQAHKDGQDNLTWGSFVRNSADGKLVGSGSVAKATSKRGPKAKAAEAESAVEKAPAKRGRKPKATATEKPAAKRGPKAKATATENAVEKAPAKRGRKPKDTATAKPAAKRGPKAKVAATESAVEKAPVKRGRKPKDAATPKPAAKRGPKAKVAATESAVEKAPAKRGRKPKDTATPKPAAKRGPKAKVAATESAVEKAPAKRGRKPKDTATPKPATKRVPKAKATPAESAVEKAPAKGVRKAKAASTDKPAAKRGPKAKVTTAASKVGKAVAKSSAKAKTAKATKKAAPRTKVTSAPIVTPEATPAPVTEVTDTTTQE